MGHEVSRRLSIVVPHLYPALANGLPDLVNSGEDGDYYLQNDGTQEGTYVVWLNGTVPAPTDEELAAAKEDAVNDFWWETMNARRDVLPQGVEKPPYEELIAQLDIQDGQEEILQALE